MKQLLSFSFFLTAAVSLFFVGDVFAHRPVIEQSSGGGSESFLFDASAVQDPTRASVAVYGQGSAPGELDWYTFTAEEDQVIPLEVLVPVSKKHANFHPTVYFFSEQGAWDVISSSQDSQVSLLEGPEELSAKIGQLDATLLPYRLLIIRTNKQGRGVFFEPFSVEQLYKGTEARVGVQAGDRYYVGVIDEEGHVGSYSLGIGTKEDFSDVSFGGLLKDVFFIKMGIVGEIEIPWLDIAGLFLLIAGFVIGLGAVTVIDLHGFLGRRSTYWTEATTRTHKVTKPLIWIGIGLALVGGLIYYRVGGFSGTATFHAILFAILVLNGLFLSFRVSPFLLKREKEGKSGELLPKKWQRKITLSFIISFLGWWSALFLLVWHIII